MKFIITENRETGRYEWHAEHRGSAIFESSKDYRKASDARQQIKRLLKAYPGATVENDYIDYRTHERAVA